MFLVKFHFILLVMCNWSQSSKQIMQVSFLNITGFRDFPLGDLPMLKVTSIRHFTCAFSINFKIFWMCRMVYNIHSHIYEHAKKFYFIFFSPCRFFVMHQKMCLCLSPLEVELEILQIAMAGDYWFLISKQNFCYHNCCVL